MILTDNRELLISRFPEVLAAIDQYPVTSVNPVEVQLIEAKNQLLTLNVMKDGQPVFIHSKYDPAAEAQKLIASYSDIDHYRHVIFYGAGMGYHIEECMKSHPGLKYTKLSLHPKS
jgi:hypothetical protein